MHINFADGLPITHPGVKMPGMARENKTAQILWRVKPSYKKRLDFVSDVLGMNMSEFLEEAVSEYMGQRDVSKKIKDADNTLAKQDAAKEGEE